MADTPRAIILFGDGLLLNDSILQGFECPALDQTAREGCCGQLAFRELRDKASDLERSMYELRQLLDLGAKQANVAEGQDGKSGSEMHQSLKERFMGMSALLYSNSKAVWTLGSKAGFDSEPLTPESEPPGGSLPDPSAFAKGLLQDLGLTGKNANEQTSSQEEGEQSSSQERDLVLVHVGSDTSCKTKHNESVEDCSAASTSALEEESKQSLRWLDALVAALRDSANRSSFVAARLFLVVVFSYHVVAVRTGLEPRTRIDNRVEDAQGVAEARETRRGLLALKPPQSYCQKEGKEVLDVREHHHAVVVYNSQWLTRRDEVRAFDVEDITKHMGNLTILADRFLYEIAFKVGRAPKYGA